MDPVKKDIQDQKVSFCDDGGRPKIKEYAAATKFRPNDEVYIRISGKNESYLVASVKGGKYTLCHANGTPAQGGITFEEKDLELKNPFE